MSKLVEIYCNILAPQKERFQNNNLIFKRIVIEFFFQFSKNHYLKCNELV